MSLPSLGAEMRVQLSESCGGGTKRERDKEGEGQRGRGTKRDRSDEIESEGRRDGFEIADARSLSSETGEGGSKQIDRILHHEIPQKQSAAGVRQKTARQR